MSLLPSWPTVAAGLVIGLAGGAYVDHAIMAHKVDKLVADHAQALATANAANQKKSDELQDTVDTLNTAAVLKDQQHAKDLESARSDVRSGRERLSIRGACSAAASAPASPSSGPGAEARTDLLPETADAIISIAGASAKDVLDYNRLLDQYNAVCK